MGHKLFAQVHFSVDNFCLFAIQREKKVNKNHKIIYSVLVDAFFIKFENCIENSQRY